MNILRWAFGHKTRLSRKPFDEECYELELELDSLSKGLAVMIDALDDFSAGYRDGYKWKGPIPERPTPPPAPPITRFRKVAGAIESEAQADFKKALIKKGHSEASANCELDRFNHLFSAWSLELALEGKNDT